MIHDMIEPHCERFLSETVSSTPLVRCHVCDTVRRRKLRVICVQMVPGAAKSEGGQGEEQGEWMRTRDEYRWLGVVPVRSRQEGATPYWLCNISSLETLKRQIGYSDWLFSAGSQAVSTIDVLLSIYICSFIHVCLSLHESVSHQPLR